MKIAKIVSSTSHILYIARVLDARDPEPPPAADEYAFGRFVGIADGDALVVGIICDSRLINPEYSGFASRLGESSALGEIKRELADDKKSLIAILLLGTLEGGVARQEIPRRSIPAGSYVAPLEQNDMGAFHSLPASVSMTYLPALLSHAGTLAVTLAKTAISQVSELAGDADKQRLAVMQNSLSWKQAFGDSRF